MVLSMVGAEKEQTKHPSRSSQQLHIGSATCDKLVRHIQDHHAFHNDPKKTNAARTSIKYGTYTSRLTTAPQHRHILFSYGAITHQGLLRIVRIVSCMPSLIAGCRKSGYATQHQSKRRMRRSRQWARISICEMSTSGFQRRLQHHRRDAHTHVPQARLPWSSIQRQEQGFLDDRSGEY